jgi:biopolymer transport protein ExbB/TolQ
MVQPVFLFEREKIMTSLLHVLTDVFYTIMNVLLLPVMIGLLVSLCIVLYLSGSFLHEIFNRKKTVRNAEKLLGSIFNGTSDCNCTVTALKIKQYLSSCCNETQQVRHFLFEIAKELEKGPKHIDLRIEKTLQDNEMLTARPLNITRAFVRLCPMLGLMGTLIPIGGALLSLSVGDLAKMSNELIVAFSTTVAGLFVASVSYAISILREQWNESDMRTMEYVSEIILENVCPSKMEVCNEIYEEQSEVL